MSNKFFSREFLRRATPILIAICAIVILSGGSYYIGYAQGRQKPETILVKGITNIGDDDVTADFSVFWEAMAKLKAFHIKGNDVADKDFVYGAIEGLTGALKDQNTIFLRPADSKKFEEDIAGAFGGIGAEIGIKDSQLIIIAPLKKSPAEKAGLMSGDKIFEIDGASTVGITVDDAVKKIRGLIGTKVVLSIGRESWQVPKDITITRGEIIVPTVDYEVVDGNLMHITLHSFNEQAPSAFYEAAVNTISSNIKGIVLDLRNDPGGFLEVAIQMAGWFLDRGQVVVMERFRDRPDTVFRARGNEAFKNTPVVILMNKGSASASEILAGALRDHRKIPLIGEKSFGKGTVQELYPLKDDSKLKITVANWVMPSGHIIEKNGLDPDYEVKITEEDIKAGRDPQLEKAKEVLKGEITRISLMNR